MLVYIRLSLAIFFWKHAEEKSQRSLSMVVLFTVKNKEIFLLNQNLGFYYENVERL